MSKGYCPICRIRRVEGRHHVKPRAEGGSDNPRNKVPLCRVCHDVTEEIYARTGMMYSPTLVGLIRMEFGFADTGSLPAIYCIKDATPARTTHHREHSENWSNKEFINEYINAYRGELRRVHNLRYNQHMTEFTEGYMKSFMKEWRRKWHEHADQFNALRLKLMASRNTVEGSSVT